MKPSSWWDETVKVQPDVSIKLRFDMEPVPPGVGKSQNKARPKRKPRPKKSARGAK